MKLLVYKCCLLYEMVHNVMQALMAGEQQRLLVTEAIVKILL